MHIISFDWKVWFLSILFHSIGKSDFYLYYFIRLERLVFIYIIKFDWKSGLYLYYFIRLESLVFIYIISFDFIYIISFDWKVWFLSISFYSIGKSGFYLYYFIRLESLVFIYIILFDWKVWFLSILFLNEWRQKSWVSVQKGQHSRTNRSCTSHFTEKIRTKFHLDYLKFVNEDTHCHLKDV